MLKLYRRQLGVPLQGNDAVLKSMARFAEKCGRTADQAQLEAATRAHKVGL